jgi:6-pyruvoyl-tetrahydropterin synthase related domain
MLAGLGEGLNSASTFRGTESARARPFFADRATGCGLALAAAAASAVVSPMLWLGNASGHDFEFHIRSWMDVARQWHAGIIFPRWAAGANYGFGEPRFIFYPPASWLLGAALGSALPWKVVPGVFTWLALVLAGLSMFALARDWLPRNMAVLAGILYAANPYHLVIVYYRSDFAELLASALLPLPVLFTLRLKDGGWRSVAPLAAAFAAIWLSNAPAGVVAAYLLALVVLAVSVTERSPGILARGSMGMAAGFGLAAFYLVPAAWEQGWVRITEVLSENLRPEQNFLFTHSNDPEFTLFNWKVSGVALGVIGVTALAAFAARRRRQELPTAFWALAALGAAAVALMFPASGPAWRWLPKLRFVQFPWRWLLALDVAFTFFFALATARTKWKRAWWLAMGLALAGLGGALVHDAWWDSDDVADNFAAIQSGRGYEGTDEYAPQGCDRSDLPADAPRTSIEDGRPAGLRLHVEEWGPESRAVALDTPRAVTLALKLVSYPAWQVEVNGRPVTIGLRPKTAQMLLALPAGSSRVTAHFTRTPDRTIGGVISAATALLLSGLLLTRRQPALGASSGGG